MSAICLMEAGTAARIKDQQGKYIKMPYCKTHRRAGV